MNPRSQHITQAYSYINANLSRNLQVFNTSVIQSYSHYSVIEHIIRTSHIPPKYPSCRWSKHHTFNRTHMTSIYRQSYSHTIYTHSCILIQTSLTPSNQAWHLSFNQFNFQAVKLHSIQSSLIHRSYYTVHSNTCFKHIIIKATNPSSNTFSRQ